MCEIEGPPSEFVDAKYHDFPKQHVLPLIFGGVWTLGCWIIEEIFANKNILTNDQQKRIRVTTTPILFYSPRSLVKMNQLDEHMFFNRLAGVPMYHCFCQGMHHSSCWCERWSKMWSSRRWKNVFLDVTAWRCSFFFQTSRGNASKIGETRGKYIVDRILKGGWWFP